MGALVGLGVGIGLMLVWSAFFLPRGTRGPSRSSGRPSRKWISRVYQVSSEPGAFASSSSETPSSSRA